MVRVPHATVGIHGAFRAVHASSNERSRQRYSTASRLPAFRLSGFPAFRLSGFPAFRLAEHYLTIPTT